MTTSASGRLALPFCAAAVLLCCGAGRLEAQPDPSLAPTSGSVKLTAGFLPDPHATKLTAGGPLKTNLGGVNAHVARAPDYRLFYTAGASPLTVHVESAADTTLLINLPDGTWVANDDGGDGHNPLLRFAKPPSGRYDIWVGTFGDKTAPATLQITELAVGSKPPPPQRAGLGIYIEQAAKRLSVLVDGAASEGYKLDSDRSFIGGGWLKQSQDKWTTVYNISLEAGKDYRVMAAGDDDAVDVDLRIVDPGERTLVSDTTTGRNATVTFRPTVTQRYDVRVRLFASGNNISCAFVTTVLTK